jgi:hypothetical protein
MAEIVVTPPPTAACTAIPPLDVVVIQTSDPVRYKPMLDITARACKRWSEVQKLHYAPFVGLKIGSRPWHAIFNRILLLAEIAQSDFAGWAVYLDADAYPFDFTVNLRAYLARNASFALIANQCQADQLLPNSGILLFNFADPRTREIIAAWRSLLQERFAQGRISSDPEWPEKTINDQSMLHEVLIRRGGVKQEILFESGRFIGDLDAVFLRQVLRRHGDFGWRLTEAETAVRVALLMSGMGGL